MKDILTRKEKGRAKSYLLEIYKSDSIKKNNNIVNKPNIISLIDILESNQTMTINDIINLKIILDSMMFTELKSLKENTSNYIYSDNILRSVYKKLIDNMG